MTIRRLRPGDAPAYRSLMLEAYRAHPEAFTSTPEERAALPMSWWEARLSEDADPGQLVVGAFTHDRLAGVAGLGRETRTRTSHKATLFGMYVAPACRGAGVGRRLVHAVLDHAAAWEGVTVVQLTVTESNPTALALYLDCGFEEFGREPLAVRVDGGFATKVHMWRPVRREIESSGDRRFSAGRESSGP